MRRLIASGLTGLLLVMLPHMAVTAEPTGLDQYPWYVKDTQFKGIEPVSWVFEGVQKVFFTPGDISTPDSLASIDEFAKMGVTVIHTMGPVLDFPLTDEDALRKRDPKLLKSYRYMADKGMRIVVGVYPYAPIALAKKHQEWRVMTQPDMKPAPADADLSKPENVGYRSLGLFTPYGDMVIGAIAQMVKTYHIDGVSFDGYYHERFNYCPYEMEMFTKETGHAFPKVIDLANPDYLAYQLWADQKLEDWYRKLRVRLKQANPQAAVYTWTTNAGRYGHFLTTPRVMSARMNMLFDSPVQEWWLDEVNLGASVVPAFGAAYVRAVTGGRTGASEPYIISRGNPYSSFNFPQHELMVRCLMAMTNGCITPIATTSAFGNAAFTNAMQEIGKRKQWFVRSVQEPWAALLVSEQNRQFYAGNQVMDRFLQHALGVFRVGMEEHLPVTLVTDMDINDTTLAKYKVLILPNAAALSDQQVTAIRQFVNNGGGLVATGESSLCNELGQLRSNFALADLFGVDYLGRPNETTEKTALDANFMRVIDDSYWRNRQGIADLRWGAGDIQSDVLINSPQMPKIVGTGVQASFKGPWVKMSEQARAPMQRAMIMFPLGLPPIPAAVVGQQGKGRVVYFAFGIDAACYSYYYPYQRVMLSNTIKWAANGTPPMQLDGPMCVQSSLFRQSDSKGERLVVQLFNGVNTTSDHGAPDTDVPLREETLPIHGMKLRLKEPGITRIHLEPGNIELKMVDKGEWTEVDLPPLEVHYMVVAELRQK